MTPFITTYTGRKVNPLDLRVEDICIEDIAHHLSNLNRFVGATRKPINIAHHSVFVMRLVKGSGWEREALFHDAAEAYLGDVSKWVKKMDCMAGYREAEERAWLVICEALDLRPEGNPDQNPVVEEADRLMVRFEHFMVGHTNYHMFDIPTHPRPTIEEAVRIGFWEPWSPEFSKHLFLLNAAELGISV